MATLKTFAITFYSPFSSANFKCKSSSIDDARAQLAADHKARGYCLENREIKSSKFDGKEIDFTQ